MTHSDEAATFDAGDAPAFLVRAVGWSLRWRLPLLLLCLGAAALAYGPAQRLQFDRSVEGMFDPQDPRLADYREHQQLFGGAETILIAYADADLLTVDGMERLEQFHSKLRALSGVEGVVSLAQSKLPGSPLDRRSLKEHLAAETVSPDEFRQEVLACDLYRGRLVSADGKTAVLLVNLAPTGQKEASRAETIQQIRAMCESRQPPAALLGGPVIVEEVYRHLEQDGRTLGLASSLVLAVVIALLFRNLRWILLPLAVVQLALLWTRALLVIGKFQLSMVSSPLTALVTVIGVATVVHVTIRFREERALYEPVEALRQTMLHLGPAIFWTCLTTAVGFCSLLASRVVPVGGFGTMMALGAILVFAAAAGLLPAGVLLGRRHTDPARAPGEKRVAALLDRIVVAVQHRPLLVSAVGLALLGVTSLGVFRLQVATDFDDNFRSNSPIVQSFRFLSERMGATSMFYVMIDAPPAANRDEFNQFLEELREAQRDVHRVPAVQGSLSMVDLLDFVADTRPDRAGPLERVTAAAINRMPPAMRVEFLHGAQPSLVSGFWNSEHDVARIIVQTGPVKGALAKRELIETIELRMRERFPSARLAGVDILLTFLVKSLLADQWITFSLAVAAILVMMTVAFRDWRLGLIALVPNVAPIVIVVGVMGWAGLKINMATAMLASVSMGLAVDFSIHYLYRFRHEMRAGKPVGEALRDAHGSVGLAMVLANIALVAGFATLTLSSFVPTVHFGVLVSVAMLGGLLGNLTALPLLLRLVYRQQGA